MLIGYVIQMYLHIAWASALLVTDNLGNATASVRGTSNKDRLPRFFYYTKHNKNLQL